MKTLLVALSVTAFLILPFAARADSIIVVNHSFETLPIGGLPNSDLAGAYSIGVAIPGWTSTDTAKSGEFQPTAVAFPTLADGSTSAWTRDASLSQQVDALVQLGVTYTLLVDIGWRADGRAFDGTADLLINGVQYAAIGTAPTAGSWSTYTASYTGLAADVGDSITIELNGTGPQGNFDNVRLSDSAAPEPAAGILVGVCLMGLGLIKRGKRSI